MQSHLYHETQKGSSLKKGRETLGQKYLSLNNRFFSFISYMPRVKLFSFSDSHFPHSKQLLMDKNYLRCLALKLRIT